MLHRIKKIINSIKVKKTRIISYPSQTYKVVDSWFWDVFEKGWEPDTFKVFKNIIDDSTIYLDLGAYIGPTALLAADCGCKEILCVEASPINYKELEANLKRNRKKLPFFNSVNRCVSNISNQLVSFGGNDLSTACSMRGDRWQVETINLKDISLLFKNKSKSLFVKVDVEGAEVLLMNDLALLMNEAEKKASLFLSLHPPFWSESKKDIFDSIKNNFLDMKLFSSDLTPLTWEELELRTLSKDEFPYWGTKYGNFFEILIVK